MKVIFTTNLDCMKRDHLMMVELDTAIDLYCLPAKGDIIQSEDHHVVLEVLHRIFTIDSIHPHNSYCTIELGVPEFMKMNVIEFEEHVKKLSG